jgi:ribonuclease Z
MRPSFYPRLVNGPFEDPGLFIPFQFENRAVLFDLGEIGALSPRDILKISHVFVSHTHMDHFIGFDRLLRLFLGRGKSLFLYGPEGFLKNIEGKLAGYSWNLVENYDKRFLLKVFEVRSEGVLSRSYACADRFSPAFPLERTSFNNRVLREPAFEISVEILDHGIPCLGFSLKEQFHINIKKDAVIALGLEIGPWLQEFKKMLYRQSVPETETVISAGNGVKFDPADLADKIAVITPGQKITYITDVAYDGTNPENIIQFAERSDCLFLEAAFLEKDRDIAARKRHLTARQAGEIAGKSGAGMFQIFHFSPRYAGMGDLLYREARQAYLENLTPRPA